MNLCWWLERASWEHPDKDAVIDADGSRVTYRELRSLANRIGNVLREQAGIGEDDVVVTVIPDNYLHVASFYAVMGLGGIFNGLNRKQNLEKFALDAKRSRPKAAIVTPEYAHIGEILEAECGVKVFVTHGDHARFPSLERLCSEASGERRIVSRSQDDIVAINFTAGTSGASKGVTFTHGTLGNSALGAIFLAGVTSEARNLSLVGMFHSGGIHDSVRLVMAGGTIIWSDGWDVERVVNIFKQHKPNWMYWIIPTMMRDLMRHPSWPEIEMKGLKTHVAGELVPPDVEAALRDKGAIVGSMYGLTEAMPVCVLSSSLYYRDEADVPVGSSGRPNKHFCEVKLKDPFTGEELTGGDVEGEICIKGDVITPGYFNDPGRTAEMFDDEGFLHTRDVGYRDANGWYFIRGRTDDMIMSGGEKLSLLEVDDTLRAHPDVLDAACVGVRHERFGEVPAAFVALKAGLSEVDAKAILDEFCIARMERWKRPRLYVFVSEVPRTVAKRSKMQGEMRRLLGDAFVRDADGVTTLSALRSGSSAQSPL
ncbi:MAG: class I adenylate-forming enzyme family protein [Pseudomonadota bacterium]